MRSFLARMPQSLAAATLAAVATAALIGGYAATFANTDTSTIQACVAKRSGAVRIVTSSSDCDARSETPVQWNQQGPQGLPGNTGPQGPQGDMGPAGTVDSLESLDSIPCGTNGTVSVSIGSGGDVSLTCVVPPPPPATCPPPAPDYPNSTASCDPTGSWVITCYPSYQDLNGVITDGCEAHDGDADSYYYPAAANQDCNDANASIHPGAVEVQNGLDDDCDGQVDEGLVMQLAMNPLWRNFWTGNAEIFIVTNQGGLTATDLNIFLMDNLPGFYAIENTTCATTLAPGASCEIVVSYTAGFLQQDDALLTVQAGDPANVATSVTAMLVGEQ